MLDRIQSIRSVGPFIDLVATRDDLRIDPLTVVYAYNGRGKSTLADVLRSLGTGDGTVFSARRRLGASGESGASFRVHGKPLSFSGGKWSGTALIHVFDERFVSENIYSGLDVGTDQLRNLARLVIGAEGVALARKSDDLAKEIQSLHIEQRHLTKEIQPKIEGMEISAFCALGKVEDVDSAISAAEKIVARLAAADTIRATPTFTPVPLRPLDLDRLAKFLATTVESVRAEARRRVVDRTRHLGRGSEQWLAEGLRLGARPNCPFCTQPTDGLPILDDYEAYFGKAYADHRASVAASRSKLDDLYGPQAQKSALLAVASQESLRVFWSKQVAGVTADALPSVGLDAAWNEGYAALAQLLDAKRSAPLDVIEIDPASKSRLDNFNVEIQALNTRLEALVALNVQIDRLKKDTASGSASAARTELGRLRNTKTRHSAALAARCDRFAVLSREIKAKSDAKVGAKAALEAHGESVFAKYAGRVNEHLGLFGAGFRIDGLKGSFEAGKAGSRFAIVLSDVKADAIDAGPRTEAEPCVGSVLSAGDRFSLALAFFLAQFPSEGDLSERIVVFDDPISSLDDQRRDRTREAICSLVERRAQVLVLSHYPTFLAEVYDAAPCSQKNALRLEFGRSGPELQTWNLEESLGTFHRLRLVLQRFVQDRVGSPDLIGKEICPFLEAYVRVTDPDRLPRGKWLGHYAGAVQALAADGRLVLPARRLKSLERLCEFCGPFRHDATRAGTPPSRHPDAIRSYAQEALTWVDPNTDWS